MMATIRLGYPVSGSRKCARQILITRAELPVLVQKDKSPVAGSNDFFVAVVLTLKLG